MAYTYLVRVLLESVNGMKHSIMGCSQGISHDKDKRA